MKYVIILDVIQMYRSGWGTTIIIPGDLHYNLNFVQSVPTDFALLFAPTQNTHTSRIRIDFESIFVLPSHTLPAALSDLL